MIVCEWMNRCVINLLSCPNVEQRTLLFSPEVTYSYCMSVTVSISVLTQAKLIYYVIVNNVDFSTYISLKLLDTCTYSIRSTVEPFCSIRPMLQNTRPKNNLLAVSTKQFFKIFLNTVVTSCSIMLLG